LKADERAALWAYETADERAAQWAYETADPWAVASAA
jgi:hypothetical protein